MNVSKGFSEEEIHDVLREEEAKKELYKADKIHELYQELEMLNSPEAYTEAHLSSKQIREACERIKIEIAELESGNFEPSSKKETNKQKDDIDNIPL